MARSIAARVKLALAFWMLFAFCGLGRSEGVAEVYDTIGQLHLVPPELHSSDSGATPPAPFSDSQHWPAGVSPAVGACNFLASHNGHRDRTLLKQDASHLAMGHTDTLSKRPNLHSSIGDICHRNDEAFFVGNAGDAIYNSGNRALNVDAHPLF